MELAIAQALVTKCGDFVFSQFCVWERNFDYCCEWQANYSPSLGFLFDFKWFGPYT